MSKQSEAVPPDEQRSDGFWKKDKEYRMAFKPRRRRKIGSKKRRNRKLRSKKK